MKKLQIIITAGLTIMFFIYPPKSNLSQTAPDSRSELKEKRNALMDSVKLGLERVNTKADLLPLQEKTVEKEKTKVVYRDRVRTVYKDRVVRDTVYVYVPVNKSEYFLESKRWSDSIALANEQRRRDSIELVWENRSWIKKFLGIKPKQ